MYNSRRVLAAFLLFGLAATVSMAEAIPSDSKVPVMTKVTGVIDFVRLPSIMVGQVKVTLTKETVIQSGSRTLTAYDLQAGMNVIAYGYKSSRYGFVATKIVVMR